jgi:solute carrier family 25 thiamine pyrophosphate transporter 19
MSKVDGKTFSIDLVAGAIAGLSCTSLQTVLYVYRNRKLMSSPSGGVARMVVAPFDLIKIRFQIQQGRTSGIFPAQASTDVQYRSVWQTIRDIVRTEGLWAFWKGTWSAQLLTMIYGAVQFSTYQQIHPLITQSVPDSSFGVSKQNAASLVGGAISGCVATVASYPFDLLRTRMAAQQDTKV